MFSLDAHGLLFWYDQLVAANIVLLRLNLSMRLAPIHARARGTHRGL